jgi:hypothetical protein
MLSRLGRPSRLKEEVMGTVGKALRRRDWPGMFRSYERLTMSTRNKEE